MLDACALERHGLPTVTLCHDIFEAAARAHARAQGMPDLPLVIEPAPRGGSITHDEKAIRALAEQLIDPLVRALCR